MTVTDDQPSVANVEVGSFSLARFQALLAPGEFSEVRAGAERARALLSGLRARIHLAPLPMDDSQENAAVVNALQRGAEVVVQKSVAMGSAAAQRVRDRFLAPQSLLAYLELLGRLLLKRPSSTAQPEQ